MVNNMKLCRNTIKKVKFNRESYEILTRNDALEGVFFRVFFKKSQKKSKNTFGPEFRRKPPSEAPFFSHKLALKAIN